MRAISKESVEGTHSFSKPNSSLIIADGLDMHARGFRQLAGEQAEKVTSLMARDLVGVPGKEVLMLTVEYLPGGASVPHRHDANVFVYVLEGALTMQVENGLPVTVKPGQSVYESPTDIHVTSANASKTASAKILVFIVKDTGKPVSRPVPGEQNH
jgi:quercetin dioxygenase-like cupin family protein